MFCCGYGLFNLQKKKKKKKADLDALLYVPLLSEDLINSVYQAW